jgi:hypothetical protein
MYNKATHTSSNRRENKQNKQKLENSQTNSQSYPETLMSLSQTRDVVQIVENLPSQQESLSPTNSSNAKTEKGKTNLFLNRPHRPKNQQGHISRTLLI